MTGRVWASWSIDGHYTNSADSIDGSIIIFSEPCLSQADYVKIAFGDVVRNDFDLVANLPFVYQCQGGVHLIMYTREVSAVSLKASIAAMGTRTELFTSEADFGLDSGGRHCFMFDLFTPDCLYT